MEDAGFHHSSDGHYDDDNDAYDCDDHVGNWHSHRDDNYDDYDPDDHLANSDDHHNDEGRIKDYYDDNKVMIMNTMTAKMMLMIFKVMRMMMSPHSCELGGIIQLLQSNPCLPQPPQYSLKTGYFLYLYMFVVKSTSMQNWVLICETTFGIKAQRQQTPFN